MNSARKSRTCFCRLVSAIVKSLCLSHCWRTKGESQQNSTYVELGPVTQPNLRRISVENFSAVLTLQWRRKDVNDLWAHDVMTIGVPTVAVLVGVLINNSRLTDLSNRIYDVNNRISDLQRYIDARLNDVKSELRAELLRVEGVLDARLRHVEDRLEIR